MSERTIKIAFIGIAFFLFSVIVIGLVWLASGSHPVSVTLAYAAGLSMIFLPCTLPLVFVIIPLSMGKGFKKGISMALLFGLGVAITLTVYGVIVALVGDYFGLDNFSRGMFFIVQISNRCFFSLIYNQDLSNRHVLFRGFLFAQFEHFSVFDHVVFH